MITDTMKQVVEEQHLGFVATVCPDGTPHLSPKGTTAVWDRNTLVFADLRSPQTVANLRTNPAVEINVVEPIARRGYRFKGQARIVQSGTLFESVLDWYVAALGPPAVARLHADVGGHAARPRPRAGAPARAPEPCAFGQPANRCGRHLGSGERSGRSPLPRRVDRDHLSSLGQATNTLLAGDGMARPSVSDRPAPRGRCAPHRAERWRRREPLITPPPDLTAPFPCSAHRAR